MDNEWRRWPLPIHHLQFTIYNLEDRCLWLLPQVDFDLVHQI